jgi:hypothetical protein
MGSHRPFGHLKHKLWPKEGSGVKLAVWLPTTKSQESPRFSCVKMACNIPLKISQQGLQLCFRPYLNPKFVWKVMAPQSHGIPTLAILGLPLGSPGTKSHLDVGPMERWRVYYKGEGGGFPQLRAVVNLVCPCCPWLVLAPKVLQLCTNHLVWVVCRHVWVNEACQLFLVPFQSSNTPLYPSKCCELGSMPRFLPLPLSCTWTHFLVLQGVGVRHFRCFLFGTHIWVLQGVESVSCGLDY